MRRAVDSMAVSVEGFTGAVLDSTAAVDNSL
jgi:hypothetical protein